MFAVVRCRLSFTRERAAWSSGGPRAAGKFACYMWEGYRRMWETDGTRDQSYTDR
jgi:hypothetical protein